MATSSSTRRVHPASRCSLGAHAVGSGFVSGLARPDGNITGFENFEPAMGSKGMGVLKDAAPEVRRVAVLFGSDSGGNVAFLRSAESWLPAACHRAPLRP